MRALSKEQILFIVVLLSLGAMSYIRVLDRQASQPVPKSRTMEADALPPRAEIQFLDKDAPGYDPKARNIFAPPRDWLPLDPLVLDPPPLAELKVVAPFTVPSLGEDRLEAYILDPETLSAPAEEPEESAEALAGEEGEETAGEAEPAAIDLGMEDAGEEEDPEIQLMRKYDWIRLEGQTSRIFGRVLNEDKYALMRNKDPIRFEHVAKASGRSMGIHDYERERVQDFGFADTVVNRIELAIRDLSFHAGNLERIHEMARWCLTLAEEDPRAVEYAVGLVERAIELDPLSKESYCLLADIHVQHRDLESAFQVLRAAIDRKLNAPGVYLRYGRLLRRYGMDDAALDAYLKAEKIEPRYAGSLAARADLCYDRGAYEEALNLYQEAWRSPSWQAELKLDVLLGEGRCLLALGRLSEASAKVQRALGLDGDSAEAWNMKGSIAVAGGDAAGARESFRRAVTLAPEHAPYITHLGIALFRCGDLEGAIRKFEEAISLDPYYSCRPCAAMGFVNMVRGEDEQAASFFERATLVNPTDFYALYLWGRTLLSRGDVGASVDILRKALRLKGSMVQILGELGYASLLAGASESASVYFEEFLKRGRPDPAVLYLAGLAYQKLNRLDEAVVSFEEAAALSEKDADPYNGLGYVRYQQGAVPEALKAFGQVLRLFEEGSTDPRYLYAKKWMTRIEEHIRKSQWIDAFQRKEIKNDWNLLQRSGPKIQLINNEVVIQGIQRQEQPDEHTSLRRLEVPGREFRIFETDLTSAPDNQGAMGIFVGLYISRASQGDLTKAEVALGVDAGGALVYRVVDRNPVEEDWVRIGSERLAAGETLRLGIEVTDYDEGRIRLLADGEPVLAEDLIVKSLKKVTRGLTLGIYAAAPGGRKVHVTVDNVRMVVRH